jgi:hypothetical protein
VDEKACASCLELEGFVRSKRNEHVAEPITGADAKGAPLSSPDRYAPDLSPG